MDRNIRQALLFIILLLLSRGTFAQTDTLFWFAAPEVNQLHEDRPVCLRVSTLDKPATVSISQPANPSFIPIIVELQANSTRSVDLTAFIDIIENKPADTILNYGLKVSSSNYVTAYYEAGLLINTDIFSLKGRNALGREFYTPFQNITTNGTGSDQWSSFDIIATEDNTEITITPSKDLKGHTAGVPFAIVLNKGQTFSCTAARQEGIDHLGGSHIISNKPIAVTVKDDSISGIAWGGCGDLVGDQLVPVDYIGNEYIITRGFLNGGNEKAIILSVNDNTLITTNGSAIPVANMGQGETYILDINQNATYIKSSNPVYMLHLSGFGCELGEPLIPSIRCTGSSQVSFTRSTNEFFGIKILTKNGNQDAFSLNGSSSMVLPGSFSVVPGTNDEWVSAQISFDESHIPTGSNNILKNDKGLFHLGIINGGSTSGARYGYFSSYNRFKPTVSGSNSCFNDFSGFSLSDTSILEAVKWDFGDPQSGELNTSVSLHPQHMFSKPGNYKVKVIYTYECGTDTAQLDFTVNELPAINFEKEKTLCQGDSFTLDAGPGFSSYKWSDGSSGQKINIDKPGTYTVTVKNSNNCTGYDTLIVKNVSKPVIESIDTLIFNQISVSTASGTTPYKFSVDGSTPQASNIFSNLSPGIHQVLVTDYNNCSSSAAIEIREGVLIFIPNAFSPNEDGINDTFGPVTQGIKSLVMKIYDRNGRLVKIISDVGGYWDGKLTSGGSAPQGIYFYLLAGLGADNIQYTRNGHVTLYRDKGSQEGISLAPNPAVNISLLKFNGSLQGDKTITIMDLSGKPLKTIKTHDDDLYINLDFLNPGIYYLKASNSITSDEIKLIKK